LFPSDTSTEPLRQEIPLNAERKVLLVEDEALVAALAVDALEELGYQAIAATRSRSSCASCAPNCPSL